MFNINDLQKYKNIYVIGHHNPDIDSIVSSYILSNILKYFKVNAHFAFLNTYKIALSEFDLLNDYFKPNPIVIDNPNDKDFILVDHHYKEDSIINGNVLGCIDHHQSDEIIGLNNYFIDDYASTTAYIYDMYKDIYTFSEEEKKLIALAILADTKFLKTSRFKESDKVIFESLNTNMNVDEMLLKYFKTSDFNKEAKDVFMENYKRYSNINTTYINALENNKYKLDEYINILKELEGTWVLIWYEYDTSKTYVYFKKNNDIKTKTYDFIASRANDIIKDII